MNTISNITKRPYIVPELEIIKLDNEISLAMESTPPEGEGETYAPEFMKENPFKNQLG